MDQDKANSIADSLLAQERLKSAPLVQSGATVRMFVDRLRAGFITLLGAYIGWRVAGANPGFGVPPELAGFLLGLVFSALVPARKT